jgi:hypothetical protein
MIDFINAVFIGIISAIVFAIIVVLSTIIWDKKRPVEESIKYAWHFIYPDYRGDWDKGRVTRVYYNQKTSDIRGKILKQDDGLYRATMWNGQYKDFIYETDAIKSVEEYKSKVLK